MIDEMKEYGWRLCSNGTSAISFNLYVNTDDIRRKEKSKANEQTVIVQNTIFNVEFELQSELVVNEVTEQLREAKTKNGEKKLHTNT